MIRHVVRFKPRQLHSRAFTPVEVHEMRYHPLRKQMEDRQLEMLSKERDPLFSVPGRSAGLGRFIAMKSSPGTTDVILRRGVQKKAVYILARHIKSQHMDNPTRILIKRTKKGKFKYTEWISRKALTNMSIDDLAEKLYAMAKKRKKYLHLLLKPNQSGGRIHEIIASNMSLL